MNIIIVGKPLLPFGFMFIEFFIVSDSSNKNCENLLALKILSREKNHFATWLFFIEVYLKSPAGPNPTCNFTFPLGKWAKVNFAACIWCVSSWTQSFPRAYICRYIWLCALHFEVSVRNWIKFSVQILELPGLDFPYKENIFSKFPNVLLSRSPQNNNKSIIFLKFP